MIKVIVDFDAELDPDAQGTLLLEMEKLLRDWVPELEWSVLKSRKADESILRIERRTWA